MEVSTYSVEVLLKSLHLLRNRTPRKGATIAMKQLRFLLRKIPCYNGICSMSLILFNYGEHYQVS